MYLDVLVMFPGRQELDRDLTSTVREIQNCNGCGGVVRGCVRGWVQGCVSKGGFKGELKDV